MSYLTFHLVFLAPPLLLLGLALAHLGARRRNELLGRRWWWAVPAVAAIAFVYTTPWDNYLVWREVWWYGPDRVVGTIGYVPVEEYLFFLLQPFLTGLWTYQVLARRRGAADHGMREVPGLRVEPPPSRPGVVRVIGALPWLALALVGVWLLSFEAGVYMGLILAWAVPVVGAMWLYLGPSLWRMVHVVGLSVAVPTLYLWLADIVAMAQGIWEISEQYTLGPRPLGLPVEEAAFFLITNVLIVFGTLLFLVPGMHALDPSPTPAVSSTPAQVGSTHQRTGFMNNWKSVALLGAFIVVAAATGTFLYMQNQDAAEAREGPALEQPPIAPAGEIPEAELVHEGPRQAIPLDHDAPIPMKVYASPTCGCCGLWVDHIREYGFEVEEEHRNDMGEVKRALGVDFQISSCHTAVVNGYVFEGHVPGEDLRRFLAEAPEVRGLTVPGMPVGSPGMEVPSGEVDEYQVLTFTADGELAVFAEHGPVPPAGG